MSVCQTQDTCALAAFIVSILAIVCAFSGCLATCLGYLQYRQSQRAILISEDANRLTRAMLPSAELFVHVQGRTNDEDHAYEIRLCNAGTAAARLHRVLVEVPGVGDVDVTNAPIAQPFFAFCQQEHIVLTDIAGSPLTVSTLEGALRGRYSNYVVPANGSAEDGYIPLLRLKEELQEKDFLEAVQRFAGTCTLVVEVFAHTDPCIANGITRVVKMPMDGSFPKPQ